MRKIKPKLSKKEKDSKRIVNEIINSLENSILILAVTESLLKEHRKLSDEPNCCIKLKPQLKRLLTISINKIDKFIENLNYKEVFKDKIESMKKEIEKSLENEMKQLDKFKFEEINYRLFRTYFTARLCINTITSNLLDNKVIFDNFKNNLKDTLKEFEKYSNFWESEVACIEIIFN